MKKILSLVMAMCLVFAATLPIQAQETTENKRITSGETVYASPSWLSWESYTISVSQSGDMTLKLKTDDSVIIKVEDSNEKMIAPYEYQKETSNSKVEKNYQGWLVKGEGSAVYHVEQGDYTISLQHDWQGVCSAQMVVTAPKDIEVKVNGKLITFDQPPVIVDGRTLVPLRAIFEALGATVDWYSETATVVSKRGNTTIKMTIGSNTMQKDGKDISLDVPAQLISDRTLVPARAVAEAFGCNVDWNGNTQTVTITE